MKDILFNIGNLFSYIFSNLYLKFEKSYKYIRTGWYSRYFKSIGKDSIIGSSPQIYCGKNVLIGSGVVIGKRFRIETIPVYLNDFFYPKIIIGNNVGINDDCHFSAINQIIIGENVLIASKVFISDNFHGSTTMNDMAISPTNRRLFSKGAVTIESNVWIGESVSILSGVTIGKGAIIGANSVVTKNVLPYTVVAGIPAREIIKNNNN